MHGRSASGEIPHVGAAIAASHQSDPSTEITKNSHSPGSAQRHSSAPPHDGGKPTGITAEH